jgi:hypothetical protein
MGHAKSDFELLASMRDQIRDISWLVSAGRGHVANSRVAMQTADKSMKDAELNAYVIAIKWPAEWRAGL